MTVLLCTIYLYVSPCLREKRGHFCLEFENRANNEEIPDYNVYRGVSMHIWGMDFLKQSTNLIKLSLIQLQRCNTYT